MAIPTLGAMIAAMGSPAEWGAVATTKLYWDDANGRLGIGTTAPVAGLSVAKTGDAWTTGSWARAIEIPQSSTFKWTKATNYCWGLFGTDNLYFSKSTADDASAAVTHAVRIDGSTGYTYTVGGVVYNISTEDSKIKVKDFISGLDKIMAMKPAVYKHDLNAVDKNGKKYSEEYPMNGEEFIGITAEEMRLIMPQAVTENPDGVLCMASGPLVFLAINAIKELNARLEKLEKPK